jgi:hypothetical protein
MAPHALTAFALLLAATLGVEQRLPTDEHYADTVGVVNFQGDEPCLSKPKVVAVASISEVSGDRPPALAC